MSFRKHKKALLLNVAVHETFYVLNRGSWFSSKRLVVDLLCWAMRTLSLAINYVTKCQRMTTPCFRTNK